MGLLSTTYSAKPARCAPASVQKAASDALRALIGDSRRNNLSGILPATAPSQYTAPHANPQRALHGGRRIAQGVQTVSPA